MDKQLIADTCENVLKKLLKINPQVEQGKLIWLLNGSTMSNILCNIDAIDGVKVSDEFRENAYGFVRQPKGDIDILYTKNLEFNGGFEYKEIQDYQNISKEQRDYNFIDHNGLIENCDINELCEYRTINGLTFIAKKPQYLLYYKFKELCACYYDDILKGNIDAIPNENIVNDVTNLYNISVVCCSEKEVQELISNVYTNSGILHEMYNDNPNLYEQIIESALNIIKNKINNIKTK